MAICDRCTQEAPELATIRIDFKDDGTPIDFVNSRIEKKSCPPCFYGKNLDNHDVLKDPMTAIKAATDLQLRIFPKGAYEIISAKNKALFGAQLAVVYNNIAKDYITKFGSK